RGGGNRLEGLDGQAEGGKFAQLVLEGVRGFDHPRLLPRGTEPLSERRALTARPRDRAAACSTGPSESQYATVPYFGTEANSSGRGRGNSGSGQEAVVDLPGDLITLTGGVLQAIPIDDGDPAPAELDKTGLLQDSGGHRHGRSPDPQHLGQELVGHRELVGAYAVLREEEPSGAALLDGVEPVAGDLLRNLD